MSRKYLQPTINANELEPKGYRWMVFQPRLQTLQGMEIPHTLNRWIPHIGTGNPLPQTLYNSNWNYNGHNKNNRNKDQPGNKEDKKIEPNISRTPWRGLTTIITKFRYHCREHYTNTDNYTPKLVHTNSANWNAFSTTHTPTHHKSYQTRTYSYRTNTYIGLKTDTTLRGCHHTDFRGWASQHALHATTMTIKTTKNNWQENKTKSNTISDVTTNPEHAKLHHTSSNECNLNYHTRRRNEITTFLCTSYTPHHRQIY